MAAEAAILCDAVSPYSFSLPAGTVSLKGNFFGLLVLVPVCVIPGVTRFKRPRFIPLGGAIGE